MTAPSLAALTERMEAADLERQQDRSDLARHMDMDTQKFGELQAAMGEVKIQLGEIKTKVEGISNAQIANAAVAAAAIANGKPKWWQQLIGGAVIGLIGWMGATIWNLQNARVDAALRREVPAAAVTVNPAQQAPPQYPPNAPPESDAPP